MKDFYKAALKVAAGAVIVGAVAAGTFMMYKRSGDSDVGTWVSNYMTNQYNVARDAIKDPLSTPGKVKDDIKGVQNIVENEKPTEE